MTWRARCATTASTSQLMAHFDAVLPGRVHRVLYENMVEDTEAEVRRLLDYCRLPFEARMPALLRERARRTHRQLRAGALTHLPRRHGAMAPLRAVARAVEGKPRPDAGCVPASSRCHRQSAKWPSCDDCRELKGRPHAAQPTPQAQATWRRCDAAHRAQTLLRRAPIAAAIMAAVPRLHAADAPDTGTLQEVVVTATKRAENLQNVPISITALSSRSSSSSTCRTSMTT